MLPAYMLFCDWRDAKRTGEAPFKSISPSNTVAARLGILTGTSARECGCHPRSVNSSSLVF
jgi:hypothetical protein